MQDEMQTMIAADLGISDLSPEEQKELISQFGLVALKAATVTLLEKLPEGKREEFAKLIESQDQPGLSAFLDRELPDHENIMKAAIAEEVKKFKEFQQSQAKV